MCDDNHERRVEARVQALLEAVDSNPPARKNKAVWLTEVTKFLETKNGLLN
jgi:hypothetical protein